MNSTELAATLSRLYKLRASDIKIGLETETAILGLLNNPERAWRAIHVAGTNGKGSVCAMLESILRNAGFKTGLYTSPHLIRFNERIRVNGECISDDELAELVGCVEKAADSVRKEPGGRQATFFELTTAIAFEHFRRKKVEIAVIETGMGGRLDATNLISPMVSIITSISLDHMAWLGTDIKSIAREKGGIIKPGIPVITGELPQDALDVIRDITRKRGSRLIQARETLSVQQLKHDIAGLKLRIDSQNASYGTIVVPICGAKTPENTALAIAAIEALSWAGGLHILPASIKQGLEQVRWPGRFHVVSRQPPVVVDGAHNPEAAKTLVRSLRDVFPGMAVGLVIGMASDKDAAGFIEAFSGIVKRLWAVEIKSDRSSSCSFILQKAKALNCPISQAETPRALEEAEKWAAEAGGVVCVAGSLFLAGEALEIICGERIVQPPRSRD